MRYDKLIPTGIASLVAAIFTAILFAPASLAFNLSIGEGAGSARGINQATALFGNTGVFTTISNLMLFGIGAVSVIMVIVGGLRYVISGGNSATITTAKNTILYAIVGLVIAILAYAIVNFVIGSFVPDGSGGGTNV